MAGDELEGAQSEPLAAAWKEDVALGKCAEQSSLSRWSTEDGAAAAVLNKRVRHYAIHTELEDAPWWQVDLGEAFPIDMIVVLNRRDDHDWRARTLRVEVSEDGEHWLLVHAGLSYFGDGRSKPALQLVLDGMIHARYVRLSLDERQYLHLFRVQVLARKNHLRVTALWREFNLESRWLVRRVDQYRCVFSYECVAGRPEGLNGPWIGLDIVKHGRFGNNIYQIINAVAIARRIGLKYIRCSNFDLLDLVEPRTFGGITFLPKNLPLPGDGMFLKGRFFDMREFSSIFVNNAITPEEREVIVSSCIRPLCNFSGVHSDEKLQDELTIHIRAGDIFRVSPPPHPYYVQPPFSFYKMVIEKLIASGDICCVRVIYQDRSNPCVGALEEYLGKNKIPFRMQSDTVQADIAALINAKHLVFGRGSFGVAICLLSDAIDSVHTFETNAYVTLRTVKQAVVVGDLAREYIRPGQWRGTEPQRRMMIDYSQENLSVLDNLEFNGDEEPTEEY